ncbi:MAG: exo-alpha-sialidase [Anaerolineae bacterium]|nr:MAG: exo-alpha-sialidase [Anaerolineae bacterium]
MGRGQDPGQLPRGNYRIAYPDVIYDNDGTILATWRKNDNATGGVDGIFSSQSTNNGATWSAAAAVPDASGTDAAHIMGQLALDTSRNQVWMAYRNSANGGDIYLKRWDGTTNAWAAAGVGHIAVATTADVETRPAVGYVADTDALWVTWHRYANAGNASARLYYVRSNTGTLPNPTWGPPISIRLACAPRRTTRPWWWATPYTPTSSTKCTTMTTAAATSTHYAPAAAARPV